nr:biotin/lipoyl attachment, acetyl-CoA biotin carboxyl carrier [Tanacetum cinerariifolium]
MASFSVPCPKISALVTPHLPNRNTSLVLFQSDFKSNLGLVSGSSSSLRLQATKRNQNGVLKVSAELNEVVGKSANSAPPSEKSSKKSSSETTVPDVASISAFMTQVAGLVEHVSGNHLPRITISGDKMVLFGNASIIVRTQNGNVNGLDLRVAEIRSESSPAADQSGTIVDIVAEDGKPVSLDTPLLVIEP